MSDTPKDNMKTDRRKRSKQLQRVNIDLPIDLLAHIDGEADRIGIPRQSVIKTALANYVQTLIERNKK